MIMDHVEFDRDPPTNLTTMVMAYGGWIDAGQAATGALRHLVRDLSAARVARIDPEQFFVFTQERPEVKMRDDGNRDIYWPRSEFFACHPWEGRDGLLLFCGPEPHQRWRSYTKAFLDIAERCGVKRIISIGALLAGAPHTRPIRVTGRSNDPTWRSVLESWGIYRRRPTRARPASPRSSSTPRSAEEYPILASWGKRLITCRTARTRRRSRRSSSRWPACSTSLWTCPSSPKRSRSSAPSATARWPAIARPASTCSSSSSSTTRPPARKARRRPSASSTRTS